MKKMLPWIFVASVVVFVIDWGIVGLKILDGDYDITVGAYIALVCIIVETLCGMYRNFCKKCPYCGKHRVSGGDYCSYCGKKVAKGRASENL